MIARPQKDFITQNAHEHNVCVTYAKYWSGTFAFHNTRINNFSTIVYMSHRFGIWVPVFVLPVLILLSSVGFASSIRGRVIDGKTKEPLAGARIALVGTKLGAISGLDGSYVIRSLEAGSYSLKVSYLGYSPSTVAVTLSATDESVVRDLSLTQLTYHGREVVILGDIDNGSEVSAQSRIQNSESVVNAVSARAIQVSPDLSVAEVSQRVSGVSISRSSSGDGQYAIMTVVRVHGCIVERHPLMDVRRE